MTSDEPEADEATLSLINAEISAAVEQLDEGRGHIGDRAGLLLGYTIVAASFLSTRKFEPVLAGFAYGCFAIAAIAGVWALALRKVRAIDPVELASLSNSGHAAVLAALIAMRQEIFKYNYGRNRTKWRAWWLCLDTVVVGCALMVASILLRA
jgi:hypothetical protein